MLIDFHTHAFPHALAPKALGLLSERSGITPNTDGTAEDLIALMDKCSVDRSVVCNIATNAKQTVKVNDFAIETKEKFSSRLTPLGSINPEFSEIESEILRLHSAGIKGLKLHPDYMSHEIDEPCYDEIFELAAAHGMFIITHAGFDVYSPDKIWAPPALLKKRLLRSPNTVFICAHFGGNRLWDDVNEYLIGENVYIDTSLGTVSKLEKKTAEKLLLSHDPERILFGSDCPWCTAKETFEYIDSLSLSDGFKEKIYFKNALSLIG